MVVSPDTVAGMLDTHTFFDNKPYVTRFDTRAFPAYVSDYGRSEIVVCDPEWSDAQPACIGHIPQFYMQFHEFMNEAHIMTQIAQYYRMKSQLKYQEFKVTLRGVSKEFHELARHAQSDQAAGGYYYSAGGGYSLDDWLDVLNIPMDELTVPDTASALVASSHIIIGVKANPTLKIMNELREMPYVIVITPPREEVYPRPPVNILAPLRERNV